MSSCDCYDTHLSIVVLYFFFLPAQRAKRTTISTHIDCMTFISSGVRNTVHFLHEH